MSREGWPVKSLEKQTLVTPGSNDDTGAYHGVADGGGQEKKKRGKGEDRSRRRGN